MSGKNTGNGSSDVAILERVIRPTQSDLSPSAARSILGLAFPDKDRRRMHELALRGQGGVLTPAERAELDNCRRVGRLLELMQSKARLSLQKRRSTP